MTNNAPESEHKTTGTIAGQDVTVIVEGPEQQVLDEDDAAVGSDIVSGRINRVLHELKEELEDD